MGWLVIAKCGIDFPRGTKRSIVDDVWYRLANYKEVYNQQKFYGAFSYISWELDGNKGIDYEMMEEMKTYCLNILGNRDRNGIVKHPIGLTISADEYTNSNSGGWYYNGENEE